MRFIAITAAILAAAVLALPAGAAPQQNIVKTAVATGQFTTLASLLTKTGLAATLSKGGPYTVYAPTDAAFAKVPKATLAALAKQPAKLKAVLLYHVVAGVHPAGATMLKTLEGSQLQLQGAKVIANVRASNGVIHVVNKVLIPPAH